MAKYTIGLGDAAVGRHKKTNKRQFRTRLADGTVLEVTADESITRELSGVDLDAIQTAAMRGFVTLEESVAPRRSTARRLSDAISGSDNKGDE